MPYARSVGPIFSCDMTKMSAQYVIRDFDDEICREHINDHCFGIGAWSVTLDMLNDQSYWTEVCRSFHTILYRERVQFQHDKVVNFACRGTPKRRKSPRFWGSSRCPT